MTINRSILVGQPEQVLEYFMIDSVASDVTLETVYVNECEYVSAASKMGVTLPHFLQAVMKFEFDECSDKYYYTRNKYGIVSNFEQLSEPVFYSNLMQCYGKIVHLFDINWTNTYKQLGDTLYTLVYRDTRGTGIRSTTTHHYLEGLHMFDIELLVKEFVSVDHIVGLYSLEIL